MKKRFLVLFLIVQIGLKAQIKKHSLTLGVDRDKLYNLHYDPESGVFDNTYLRYSYRFNSNLAAFAEYNTQKYGGSYFAVVRPRFSYESEGKLIEIKEIHYADIGLSYKLFAHRKHSVQIRTGISRAFAPSNFYATVIAIRPARFPRDPMACAWSTGETKSEKYWGGVTGLNYGYTIWKQRLTVGVNFSVRYYTHDVPFQINYGIFNAFNF